MKIRMDICGQHLLLPLDIAEQIMEIAFKHGECYENKWNRGEEGNPAYYTGHVYPIDPSGFKFCPEVITEGQYEMYKMAGKP